MNKQYTQQQVDEVRAAWENGINGLAEIVVMNYEAVRLLPEIGDYDGEKIIILLPNERMNQTYLETLKNFFSNNDN